MRPAVPLLLIAIGVATSSCGRFAKNDPKLEAEFEKDVSDLVVMEASVLAPALRYEADGMPPTDDEFERAASAIRTKAARLRGERVVTRLCSTEAILVRTRGGLDFRRKANPAQPVFVLAEEGLDRAAELDRRLALLTEFEVANARLLTARETTAFDVVARCLRDRKVDAKKIESGAALSRMNAYHLAALELLRANAAYVGAARPWLTYLRSTVGRHHYDRRRKLLVFDLTADKERALEHTRPLDVATQRRAQAEKHLWDLIAGPPDASDAG